MKISSWVFLGWILFIGLFTSQSLSIDNFRQAFPIVEPDPGHTKLRLSRVGLEAIERITTPVAAVVVASLICACLKNLSDASRDLDI